MAAAYKYTPLQDAREIRVLHLLPGTGDVRFTLQTVHLDASPKYEAISYCWGDASTLQTVGCEDKTLQVTPSLFTALRRLRLPDRPRTLWADAVCINQADLSEKGSQVKLMSQIYSKTWRILIWLGEDTTGLEGVGGSVEEALRLLPEHTYDGPELMRISREFFGRTAELREKKQTNVYDHDWTSINHLFARPWFERKWIIQEVAMAPDEVPRLMMCGDIELSWADVASVAYRLGAYGISWPLAGLSVLNHFPTSMASFWLNGVLQRNMGNAFMIMIIKHYRLQASLLDAFVATVFFKCTNPRDHVYALLNLVPSFISTPEPDYSLPVADVWRRFAQRCLVDDQNLKFLALAVSMPSPTVHCSSTDEHPSWVPRHADGAVANPLSSYSIRPPCFRAGGDTTPRIAVSDDGRRLHLRGRVVDTIKATVPTLFDSPVPSEEDILPKTTFCSRIIMWKRNWVQACRDTAADGANWEDLSPARKRDFTRTVICEMTGMRDAAPEEVVAAVDVYVAYLYDFFTPGYVLEQAERTILRAYSGLIESSMLGLVAALRFCVTEEGRFGRVSKRAEAGDVVCVLLGAEVPYVLRPTGRGTYRLVGDGYLCGVMHGEAVEDGRYETVDIVLE